MTDNFEQGPLKLNRVKRLAADRDSVDLWVLVRGFWRDRAIFFGVTILCGLIAAILVAQVTPLYNSMSQVLLDPREQRLVISEQVVSDRQLNDQVMGSEISIMRSNTLLEAVINKLDTDAPEVLAAIDPVSRAPSLLKRIRTSISELFSGAKMEDTEAVERARLARLDRLTSAIRRSLDTWRDGDSYVISISVETPDPMASMQLAGAIAEQYVQQQLDGRRSSSAQAADWIELRVEDLRIEVNEAEAAVEDYRASSIERTGSSFEIISQRLVSLNDELINARVALVTAESRFNEIERVITEEGFTAIGGMFTSAPITALNSQRLELLAEDAQWAESFDTDHPERRKIAAQLEEISRALVAETRLALDTQRNEVQIARIRENTMNESLEEAEQQFLSISRSAIGLRQLEREAEVARNMYTDLLNRFTETRTKEQLQQADSRIIERATFPGAPSSPRPKLMTMLGLLIGAALGVAIIAFRQLTKGSYGDISEMEQDTGLPVLCAIPERKWKNLQSALDEVEAEPAGAIAESIRRLRNELSINDKNEEAQSIALLSPLQAEGKTTTTMLLARLTEKSDKLVIVVDCNFRQNAIQRDLKGEMDNDFVDYLRGDVPLLSALQTETGQGFDLLTAREPNNQSSDLLTKENLQNLLEELKQYYDVVLVNCPAMLSAAEALVIARAVDQRVLLARYEKTPRAAVKRCLGILENNELSISGQVLTRIDPAMLRDNAEFS